ncbi:MAG: FAD-binding protein [Phycisphaerales bacterium]|nr:FAD-binding protein [Phycisphaerales bacterium]
MGGPAQVLAHPSSLAQLSTLAQRCHEKRIPVYVLGDGANLLIADEGVKGVVIKLDDSTFKQVAIDAKTGLVTAGAGVDLKQLVLDTAKAGLAGLECLAGIPATVGGAVKMNAGGAYGDIGRAVSKVHLMDATGQSYSRDRDDLVFAYRKTNIVGRFITAVDFALTPDDPETLVKRVKEIFAWKSATQPLGAHSAGCAFKNPPPDVGASAGQLIDRAGLKGFALAAPRYPTSTLISSWFKTRQGSRHPRGHATHRTDRAKQIWCQTRT